VSSAMAMARTATTRRPTRELGKVCFDMIGADDYTALRSRCRGCVAGRLRQPRWRHPGLAPGHAANDGSSGVDQVPAGGRQFGRLGDRR
jgi:hypothetical protein